MTDALGPKKWLLDILSLEPIEVNVCETSGLSARVYPVDGGHSYWVEAAMLKDTAHEATIAQTQYIYKELTGAQLRIRLAKDVIEKIRRLLRDNNLPLKANTCP